VGKERTERFKPTSLLWKTPMYNKTIKLQMAWMLFCPTPHLTDVKPESRKEKDVVGIW